jgi:hypothetical protein
LVAQVAVRATGIVCVSQAIERIVGVVDRRGDIGYVGLSQGLHHRYQITSVKRVAIVAL